MLLRGGDGSPSSGGQPSAKAVRQHEELRPATRSRTLGVGTLACERCDAPVAAGPRPLSLTDPLRCPFCHHDGRVRDFLSLAAPARPARVVIRVVAGS
jgi:hypothetical protein